MAVTWQGMIMAHLYKKGNYKQNTKQKWNKNEQTKGFNGELIQSNKNNQETKKSTNNGSRVTQEAQRAEGARRPQTDQDKGATTDDLTKTEGKHRDCKEVTRHRWVNQHRWQTWGQGRQSNTRETWQDEGCKTRQLPK